MAQTLVRLSTHAVFSTKERRNLIMPEVESDLYAYLSSILKNIASPCIEVNGTANHLHVLFLQSKNLALCDTGFLHPWLRFTVWCTWPWSAFVLVVGCATGWT
ncbi:MAG TPA: transposase [Acidobacteriota bacterium]|jgi:hypothetical protein